MFRYIFDALSLSIFLLCSLVMDLDAMENPKENSRGSLTKSARSILKFSSSGESPGRHERDSSHSPSRTTPRKLPRAGRSHSDSSDSHHQENSIEQMLFAAIRENNNQKVTDMFNLSVNCAESSSKRTPLILATCMGSEAIVATLLTQSGIDVNKVDKYGNSALHCAALHSKEVIIEILLNDYRVNSYMRNRDGRYAHQILDWEKNPALLLLPKLLLFARSTLDLLINGGVCFLKLTGQEKNAGALTEYVEVIKNGFVKDHNNQKDYQALPEETKLPAYATDEFIKNMILYRLENWQETKEMKKIDDLVKQEIFGLQMSKDTSDDAIKQSIEGIKDGFAKKKKDQLVREEMTTLPVYASDTVLKKLLRYRLDHPCEEKK